MNNKKAYTLEYMLISFLYLIFIPLATIYDISTYDIDNE